MLITRSRERDGGIFPSALNYLTALPESVLHHGSWPSRHPLGIYNLSTGQVLDALEKLFPLLAAETEKFRRHRKIAQYMELLKVQRDLLFAMRAHVDDCYAILKTLVDPALHEQTGVHTDVFLKRVKMPGLKRFTSVVEGYVSEQLGPLVNSLKHHHGQLCPVILYDEADAEAVRLGYYLEEAWDGQSLGPSWRVHRDGNSGFSLARDTLVHIYWLYEISERLTATISAVLRTWHRVEIEPQRYEPKRDRWTEAMRSAAALPLEPFPNEVTWPSAAIDLMESPESLELQLEYPKKVSHRWQPANLKVQITTSADGAARGFKLPYMGKPRRPKRRGPAA